MRPTEDAFHETRSTQNKLYGVERNRKVSLIIIIIVDVYMLH
jgi:hypothetical protein